MAIKIDFLKINAAGTAIEGQLNTTDNASFYVYNARIRTENTYGKPPDSLTTIESVRVGANTSAPHIISIPLEKFLDPSKKNFTGLFFFDFYEYRIGTTPATTGNTALSSSATVLCDLTQYHHCIDNKLLAIDLCKEKLTYASKSASPKDCAGQPNPCGCPDCPEEKECNEITDDCGNGVFFANALLNTIYRTLECEEYAKAIQLLNRIKQVTDRCCTFDKDPKALMQLYVVNDKRSLCVVKKT